MASQPYVSQKRRQGVGGNTQLLATLVKVTAADTTDFGSDLTKVTACSIIGDSKNAPAITAIAGGSIAGSVVTWPAGYANDDLDVLVIGPSSQQPSS
jgi:hypothetical protein